MLHLLVIERDEKAPVYPLHYTMPSGRCDRNPCLSALDECAQEICAVLDNAPLLPYVDDPRLRDDFLKFKREQIVLKRAELERLGVDIGDAITGEPVWMHRMEFLPDRPLVREIIVYIQGIEKSRFSAAAGWYESDNAFDFNHVVAFTPHWPTEKLLKDLHAVDGEQFGRKVGLRTPESLRSEKLIPPLRNYVENRLGS